MNDAHGHKGFETLAVTTVVSSLDLCQLCLWSHKGWPVDLSESTQVTEMSALQEVRPASLNQILARLIEQDALTLPRLSL